MICLELDLIARVMRGVQPPILDVGSSTLAFRRRPKLAYDLAELLGRPVVSVDAKRGPGVDVVVDVHELTRAIAPATANAVICTSLLEHVTRPWLVVAQIAAVLVRGGVCLLTAPWQYNDHPDPLDCYRFSPDGLRGLVGAALREREAGVFRYAGAVISYYCGEKP